IVRSAIDGMRKEAIEEDTHRTKTSSLEEQLESLQRRYDKLDYEVGEILEMNESLEQENAALRAEVSDLVGQVQNAKENLAAVYGWKDEEEREAEEEAESEGREPPDSWAEFADQLDEL